MNLTSDRQGYLGDLTMKSLPELKELLERHEKLLSKRKFLETLPDKGEKSRKFTESLRQIIDLKSRHVKPSSSAQIYSVKNTRVPLTDKHSSDATSDYDEAKQNESDNQLTDLLESVARRDEQNTRVQQGQPDSGEDPETRVQDTPSISVKEDTLIAGLEQMDLGTKPVQKADTPHFTNSYERVIKKTEETPSNINKFKPYRSLLDTHIPPSPYEHKTQTKKDDLKHEESAAKPPQYKYKESKLISVEESVKLIQEQRSKIEKLTAERAAKRLADQLGPRMEKYSPQHVDMQYREADAAMRDSDDDDDDDDDDCDDDDDGDT